ncbi:hypothetical protein IAD21_01079 [Abditibacteriota bacterium]|nr:hypothetical protein IAD21_01079 [Abditibacteriota bacterium]
MVLTIVSIGTIFGIGAGVASAHLLGFDAPYNPAQHPVGSQDSYAMATGFATIGLVIIGSILGLIMGLITALALDAHNSRQASKRIGNSQQI